MIRFSATGASAVYSFVVAALISFSMPAHAQDVVIPDQRISALFFGEIDYRQREDLGNDGFVIGQAVAQFNFQIDERFSAFTEMTATARQDHGFEFEIERLFVRYDFSDYFKLSGGRYHTPLGYWNSAYHHGSWLQTTVSRPETVKFGSLILPIHFVGVLLEGNIGSSDFTYRAGFGNGRAEEIKDPGDLGDVNDRPAWLLATEYRPPGRLRLRTGLSVYVDEIEPELEPVIDEQIYTAFLALENETPEVIVEYTHSDHESSLSRGSVNSIYGQVAYRLGGKAYRFKPYIRAEKLDVDDDDPLLGGLGLDYEGIVAGTRWDFSPFAVLKAEVRREDFDDTGSRNSFWLQLAFVFDATANRQAFIAQAPQDRGIYR